eukprot:4021756-Prorocentrum_lima.AAC.1
MRGLSSLHAKPSWVASFLMWDETGEKLVMPIGRSTLRQSSVSSVWQILVAKITFAWGWED